MKFALWLHVVAMTAWIGGMFFAHVALRPSVGLLAPPQRLPLLAAVMARFLAWVAAAIVVIFGSGVAMIVAGGAAMATPSVRTMAGLAVVMTIIYVYIVAAPFKALKRGVADQDWPAAAAAMAVIRPLIFVNLVLGVATIAAAMLLR